jgi:hypothetical protein
MPNQRKKSKVHLGGYYEKVLKEELATLAKAKGTTVSKLVEQILEDAVADYKRRKKTAA